MTDESQEISEANTSLIIGLFATLAKKKVITPTEALEIVEQSTLRLEEMGAPAGGRGAKAHAYLTEIRRSLSTIFGLRP